MKIHIHTSLKQQDKAVLDLDIDADSGLEVLKFQIFSLSNIPPEEQLLLLGQAAHPLKDDVDLRALLKGDIKQEELFMTVVRLPDVMAWRDSVCTKVLLGSKAAVQPVFIIPGSEQHVCGACASLCFPPGLLVSQIGGPIKPFVCASMELCAGGLGTYLFESRLGEAEAIVGPATVATNAEVATSEPLPPPALGLLAILQEAAFRQQAFRFERTSPEARQMAMRLQNGYETVRNYESAELQAKALKYIPVEFLYDRAIAAGGDPQRCPHAFRDLLFRELLAWFKQRFFRWVNQPPCDGCGKGTSIVGGAAPNMEEQAGQASRIEVYKCNESCPIQTRFPRYNDPGKLLETQRGRCGEWANCFTLCCRALGFEARYILDLTDHVWTEVYSDALGRWIHADACENRADHPYMYERGWGKKLSYVVGFAKDGVCDVTRRYTRSYHEALSRRTDLPEMVFSGQLQALDRHVRAQWLTANAGLSESRSRELDNRARREQYELACGLVLDQVPSKPGEMQGRISGDAVWKRLRGEDGRDAGRPMAALPSSPSSSSQEVVEVNLSSLVEREDIADLHLWSAFRDGPPCLVISATSVGLHDIDPCQRGNSLPFGPSAITINGIPAAVGSRGHNIVIIDLATAKLERSVVIDTAIAAEDEAQTLIAKANLEKLLTSIPQGRMVVSVVISSGQAGSETSAWGSGFPQLPSPGVGEAWMVVGQKDGNKLQPWAIGETRTHGKGPVHVVLKVPIPRNGAQEVKADVPRTWEGGIATTPLWHYMGPESDGIIADPEATYTQLKETASSVPVCGYSFQKGKGMALMGRTSTVRAGDGWMTKAFPPTLPVSAQPPADLQSRIKVAFANLVQQGVAPNAAAAQALAQEKDEMSKELGAIQLIRSLGRSGNPRPAEGESWLFNDTEIAYPHQAMIDWEQNLPLAHLRKLRLWSSGSIVVGIQAGYELQVNQESESKSIFIWSAEHRAAGAAANPSSGTLLELETGEDLTQMEVRSGPRGIEGLSLVTSKRKLGDWGRKQTAGVEGEETQVYTVDTKDGWKALAIYGSVGVKGLQTLGLVVHHYVSADDNSMFQGPLEHVWGLYTSCPIDRSCRQLVLGSGDSAKTLEALRAARRFLANCIKEPANPKFRTIRCRTAFFLKNLGCLPGSGLLMSALGFNHIAGGVEGEACYELPLFHAGPALLERLTQRLDVNIARVEGMI